ncbi:unnamed protein product [Phytomonas sp. EM1]|nr:unnamed protein product [Phytomonas sp. EM1]|eukprot:CCW61880.1 unnamed protein product [Phytomonas sp. isolate EM1]
MLKQLRCSTPPGRSRSFRFSIIALMLGVILAATMSHALNDVYVLTPKQQLRASSGIITHHSLNPPFLQNYYGESELTFWKFSGSTVITDSYIRLTTHNAGEVGHLWNKEPVDMDAFEIVLGFRVFSSDERRRFADGFALWITKDEPGSGGPILGHPMSFVGVGILFDDFDNDGRRDNPTVGVLYNEDERDRNRRYSPDRDFQGEYKAACNFDYTKLSSSDFATARIRYNKGSLQVFLSVNDEKDEHLCANLNNIKLSTSKDHYSLGLTAQTGSLSCNHDIVFLHVSPLSGTEYSTDIHKAFGRNDRVPRWHQDGNPRVLPTNPPQPQRQPPQQQPPQQQPPQQQPPQQQPPQYQQPPQQQQQPPQYQQPPQQQQQVNPTSTKQGDPVNPNAERLKELERQLEELRRANAAH